MTLHYSLLYPEGFSTKTRLPVPSKTQIVKKRIFISGPMTGIPGYNYEAFHVVADRIRRQGDDPLNPAAGLSMEEVHPWDWYMRRSLSLLLTAEEVWLLPGWETSRGATLERHVAEVLGLPIEERRVY
jgi:hypothetical protein